MNLVQLNQYIELNQQQLCSNRLKNIFPWFTIAALIVVSIVYFKDKSLTLVGFDIEYLHVAIFVSVPFFIGLVIKCISYLTAKKQLAEYREMSDQLVRAEKETKILSIQKTVSEAQKKADKNSLVKTILESYLPVLNSQVGKLRQARLRGQLDREVRDFKLSCDKELAVYKDEAPLVKAKANI